jgi:hypothetical protein
MRVGGLIALLASCGLLGQAYSNEPNSPLAYALYWLGLGAAFLGVLAIGVSPRSRPHHHLFALAALGAVTYLPTYLRNPSYPLFQDELFHVQSLQLMRDLGTTHIPFTNFPIPGAYPGLELLGLAVMFASGLSLDVVVRLIPLAVHVSIPVVAYLGCRSCKLRPSIAFFGALVYAANWAYYWFHATYSYESLGVVFYLLVVTLAVRLTEPHRGGRVAATLGVLLATSAVVITHHISSIFTAVMLAVLAGAFGWLLPRRRSPLVDIALFCVFVMFGWLVYQATATIGYLSGNFIARLSSLLALFQGAPNATRQLYWNSPVPVPEQIISYLYPVIVACLIGMGLYTQGMQLRREWRERHTLHISPARLTFAVIGPLLWLATAPGVITRVADVIYRSWTFLFFGVALYAAIGATDWLQDRTRLSWLRRGGLYATVGLLLAGGVILGGNQAGRFRAPEIHSSAGPEAFTEDLVSASQWLEGNAGRFHFLIGDSSSAMAFAVWGIQRTDEGVWPIFYTPDTNLAQLGINFVGAEYVAVDLRDSEYLPRYGFYFDGLEFLDERRNISAGEVMPLEDLTKFDQMPDLRRIYDNGDIIVYRNTSNRAPAAVE